MVAASRQQREEQRQISKEGTDRAQDILRGALIVAFGRPQREGERQGVGNREGGRERERLKGRGKRRCGIPSSEVNVVVNGPRDTLSNQQRAWIAALTDAGIEVEVLKARELKNLEGLSSCVAFGTPEKEGERQGWGEGHGER